MIIVLVTSYMLSGESLCFLRDLPLIPLIMDAYQLILDSDVVSERRLHHYSVALPINFIVSRLNKT